MEHKKILFYKLVWANCNRTGITVHTKLRSAMEALCALQQCSTAVQEGSSAQAHGNLKTSKAITASVGSLPHCNFMKDKTGWGKNRMSKTRHKALQRHKCKKIKLGLLNRKIKMARSYLIWDCMHKLPLYHSWEHLYSWFFSSKSPNFLLELWYTFYAWMILHCLGSLYVWTHLITHLW